MTRVPDCPMCQTPNPWEARFVDETYCYKGQEFPLRDIEYSECRVCGFDVVLPRQKRRNEARIRDQHRRIDGLLTGHQIKAIRKNLGLSQAQAADLLGGGANAFSKYERGEVIQSLAMNKLLLLLAAMPHALKVVAPSGNSPSVQIEQVSRPRTVQVPDETTERSTSNWHTKGTGVERRRAKRMANVEDALDCRVERLAA